MRIQSTSVQAENTTDQNEIEKMLEALSVKYDKMLTKSPLGEMETDFLEQNIEDLCKVIAMKTQENFGNNAQKRTMGVFGSHVSIGSDPRNLGT